MERLDFSRITIPLRSQVNPDVAAYFRYLRSHLETKRAAQKQAEQAQPSAYQTSSSQQHAHPQSRPAHQAPEGLSTDILETLHHRFRLAVAARRLARYSGSSAPESVASYDHGAPQIDQQPSLTLCPCCGFSQYIYKNEDDQ